MGLVNDNGVVSIKVTVMLHFCEQNAISHKLYRGLRAHLIVKPNGIADTFADALPQFVGNALRHSPSGQPARLGVSNESSPTPTNIQTNFRNLRGFA